MSMTKVRWMFGVAMLFTTMLVMSSRAAILVSNNFSFAGALTANGWTAYNGADGSITSDLSVAWIGGGLEDINTGFTDQTVNPTYASFILNIASLPTVGGEYSFGFTDGTLMESRFGIAVTGGGTNFRLAAYGSGSTPVATSGTDLSLGTDYKVVFYFDGVNDHRLWINPNSGSFGTPDAQATAANNGMDGFFIRQAGALDAGAARWSIDNVTVATTFSDLVSGAPVITTNVRFSVSAASVAENAGTYVVTVTKSVADGNVSGEITLGGTATEGVSSDYTIDTTNFVMNGATTSATFTITINDDVDQESAETIALTLANVTGATIASPSVFTLTISANDVPPPVAGVVWINELNYDDTGTDSNEYIEIAGPAGVDLSPYSLVYYNGGDGNPYGTNLLSGIIPDEGCGFGAISFSPTVTLQNGPDGLVLLSNGVAVLQFLSYGGATVASNGPAMGLTADPFPLNDTGGNISLQLAGVGDEYADFAWQTNTWSAGLLNPEQAITNCTGVVATNVSFSSASSFIGEQGIGQTVYVLKSLAEGNVSGEIIVSGTATEGPGNDFTVSPTNFTLNGTTTSNLIIISVNDDGVVEPDETVVLTLVNVVGGTLVALISFTLTIVNNDFPPQPNGPVWINEINYDDLGADSNEFVEIAGPAGTDLSVYSILLYNGGTGLPYGTNALTGVIDDEGCGYGAVSFAYPADGIQNGTPDGLALVSNGTTVIQFLGYEGTFAGSGGPASGFSTIDVGPDDLGDGSVQLEGSGSAYADYAWATNAMSAGSLNLNQTIVPCGGGGDTTLDEYDVDAMSLSGGTFSITISASSNGVPYTLIYTTNILTNPQGSGTADVEAGNGGPLILQDVGPTDSSRLYWIRSNN